MFTNKRFGLVTFGLCRYEIQDLKKGRAFYVSFKGVSFEELEGMLLILNKGMNHA